MKKSVILILALLFFAVGNIAAQDNFAIKKEQRDVMVYPNPLVGNKLTVKADVAIGKVEIINVLGKTIKAKNSESNSQRSLTVFTDKQKQGMYLVKVTFKDNIFVIRKLLVKN